MLRRSLLAASAAGFIPAGLTFSQASTMNTVKTGYAPVNGLQLYYEIHGSGQPLILLHGGVGSTEMFGEIMPSLCKVQQVIAVDLQAHGRTADIDRPLRYELMADDISALMTHLKIDAADLMGYSLGAGVALRTTIQHPGLVKRLIVVSAAYKRDGWYPEIRAAMGEFDPERVEQMKNSPMYQTYARVAPRPEDWPVLFRKLADLLARQYDWSTEVANIKAPTLLVFGDADAVSPVHAVEFFELLGGGKKDGGWDGSGISKARLAILPGYTHYNILSSPALAPTATGFLS